MSKKYGYVPLLRWKRGERVGLQQLRDDAKDGVMPIFMLSQDQFGETKKTSKAPARTAAESFCFEAKTAWGEDEFYLDAAGVGSGGAAHPIAAIAECAADVGLAMVPSTRLDAPTAYQKAVNSIAAAKKTGMGLKVDLQQMTSASSWASSLARPLQEIDLLVDLENNVGAVASLGAAALGIAFASLFRAAEWRSVTLIGTSLPDNFSGYGSGTHVVPRIELSLWRSLVGGSLPYRLDFGDYCTVPANAPPPGISWGFPINVKYTLRTDFLVCRGVRTTGFGGIDQGPQLVGHAKSIVAYPDRLPLDGCWGDATIDRIASGVAPPKGLEHWVQIGISRHIHMTRGQLP